jgi:hypothetical protein
MCCLLAVSCTVDRADSGPTEQRRTSVTADTTAGHRYGIRSARLIAVSDRPGQSVPDTSVFVFDQFGRVERSEQVVELPMRDREPVRKRTIVIRNDRTIYTLDPGRKVARTTVLADPSEAGFIDFMGLSDEALAAFHVVRNGRDTILGRPCDVFRIDDRENDMQGTYYVWMNIPLQIDITIRGARMTTRPVRLDENIDVDASLFSVPADYRTLDTP